MKSRKGKNTIRVSTLSLALLIGISSANAAEIKPAKLGHSFSDSHPRAQAMNKFVADVEAATGGAVKITLYGNSVLGSEQQML